MPWRPAYKEIPNFFIKNYVDSLFDLSGCSTCDAVTNLELERWDGGFRPDILEGDAGEFDYWDCTYSTQQGQVINGKDVGGSVPTLERSGGTASPWKIVVKCDDDSPGPAATVDALTYLQVHATPVSGPGGRYELTGDCATGPQYITLEKRAYSPCPCPASFGSCASTLTTVSIVDYTPSEWVADRTCVGCGLSGRVLWDGAFNTHSGPAHCVWNATGSIAFTCSDGTQDAASSATLFHGYPVSNFWIVYISKSGTNYGTWIKETDQVPNGVYKRIPSEDVEFVGGAAFHCGYTACDIGPDEFEVTSSGS